MEHKFTSYVIWISLLLAFIGFLISGLWTNYFDALGILIGAGWGCANFFFLKKLLEEWLKLGSRNPLKLYTAICIKFPVLYLAGYRVLKLKLFPVLYLILGFSLLFIAIFLLGLVTLFITKEQANIGSKTS